MSKRFKVQVFGNFLVCTSTVEVDGRSHEFYGSRWNLPYQVEGSIASAYNVKYEGMWNTDAVPMVN